ncbi:MAG: helix-turn-helix transcriptional regulator [Flavobacteriales bacterium]|nr:helix-turn-helix transcriptional regulator [Flavobacteriales bacterium]
MGKPVLFGVLLKRKRLEKNLKLKDLAGMINMDIGLLSKIENNERLATENQLKMLMDALNVDKKAFETSWLSSKIIREIDTHNYPFDAIRQAGLILHELKTNPSQNEDLAVQIEELKTFFYSTREIPVKHLPFKTERNEFTASSFRLLNKVFSVNEALQVLQYNICFYKISFTDHLKLHYYTRALDYVIELALKKQVIEMKEISNVIDLLSFEGLPFLGIQNSSEIEYKRMDNYLRQDQVIVLSETLNSNSELSVFRKMTVVFNMFVNYSDLREDKLIVAWLVMNYILLFHEYPLLLLTSELYEQILNFEPFVFPNTNELEQLEHNLKLALVNQLKQNLEL